MPALKVCEKLKKFDAQVCDLRFGEYLSLMDPMKQSRGFSFFSNISLFFSNVLSICDTDKQIDLTTVDLKKLKVRDLKKVLNDWDEVCDGCLEKTDYIRRIEELKPKYAPAAKEELQILIRHEYLQTFRMVQNSQILNVY